jgi:hypothetical protein
MGGRAIYLSIIELIVFKSTPPSSSISVIPRFISMAVIPFLIEAWKTGELFRVNIRQCRQAIEGQGKLQIPPVFPASQVE